MSSLENDPDRPTDMSRVAREPQSNPPPPAPLIAGVPPSAAEPETSPPAGPPLPLDPLALTEPPPPDAPPPLVPPPSRPRDDGGRLGGLIPVLLATLGLAAAVIAWRAGVAAGAADDATRAGIDAGRERAATIISNAGVTARATEAYLDYERARRRAEALASGGAESDALLNRMDATSHWFLVPPEYLDRNGQFQPAQEQAALLADAEANKDIQPQPHFTEADAEYDRLRGLIGAGIVVALALPFLTIAEIGRGRLRAGGILVGSAIFGVGLVLAAIAWL